MVSKGPLSDPVHWWDNWHVMKQLFDATLLLHTSQKSDNLHYNTLYCLVDVMNDLLTMRLISQALFFFHNLLQTQNSKMKGFLQRIYKKLWNKNDTFTIRQWVVCPSNPSCYTKDCWIFSSKTLYIGERNSRRLSSLGHKNLKHHAMPNVVDFICTFWLSFFLPVLY